MSSDQSKPDEKSAWKTAKSVAGWAVSPSITGRHNNPAEGALEPLTAVKRNKPETVKYEDVLTEVKNNGGDAAAFQLKDLHQAHKLRRMFTYFFIFSLVFLASTLSFLPDSFGHLAGWLFAGPVTSCFAAIVLTDRNVLIVRRGKHMTIPKYLLGGFCERSPIKAG